MEPSRIAKATSGAGRSLLEMLWEELDRIMDILMTGDTPVLHPDRSLNNPHEFTAWGEIRGQAQGVAYCIAVIEQPYQPNVPDIKERAMERFEERDAE